ncbi:hypothetical protein EXIGLDRAFT_373206 [Exidia glandulosa HHB12029]|uniref:Uncharacterized protein n=1 Tax=Exidia glandulosa HHB12029 TaxID=1314781 RepID=A0A165PXG5_EXIGL|nr:hypothetical protein EXIGLDRAFT_373206 [Exidia glandulosa HHB12029]
MEHSLSSPTAPRYGLKRRDIGCSVPHSLSISLCSTLSLIRLISLFVMRRAALLGLFIALFLVLTVHASPAGALDRRGKRPKAPVVHSAPKKTKGKRPTTPPPSRPHSPVQGSSGGTKPHPVKVKTKPKGTTSSPPHSRPQSPTKGGTAATGQKPSTGTRPPSRAGSTSSNHGSTSSRPQSPVGRVFDNEIDACKEFKSCTTCVGSEAEVVDPNTPHDPTGKGKAKAKVVRAHCGWKPDPKEAAKGKGSCLPAEHGPASLLTTKEQCDQLTSDSKNDEEQKKNDATRRANAVKEFGKIKTHVLAGGSSPASGRHIASAWFKRNKRVPAGAKVNAAAGLGEVPFGLNDREMKTLWLDVDGPVKPDSKQPALNFRGHFTQESVTEMCVQAYIYSMKANKESLTTPLPASASNLHAFAVRAPNGHTLCIELNGASCYPNSITPTTRAPGQKCPTISQPDA